MATTVVAWLRELPSSSDGYSRSWHGTNLATLEITMGFEPPQTVNVIDQHGGFTEINPRGDTLWRPGAALDDTNGVLVAGSVNHNDFYQLHEPVVSALYKCPRHRRQIKIWWSSSGERIA